MAVIEVRPWAGTFDELTPDDRLSAARTVFDGKAVLGTVEQITDRLQSARILAILREEGSNRIVGVAALKNPNAAYRRKTFDHARVAINGYKAAPELGYVVVAEDMRGNQLSGKLVELIAAAIHQPTFATTNNETMKKNLLRAGFTKVGQEWKGQKAMLSLWTLVR